MKHDTPPLRFNQRMTKCTLTEPMEFIIFGASIMIPQGFPCDGASIPRWARWAIPKWGPHTWAAILHDEIYGTTHHHGLTRAEADRLLYRIARDDGMHLHTALIMWAAVRIGGRWYWRT